MKYAKPITISLLICGVIQQVFSYATTTTYDDVVEARTNVQRLEAELEEAKGEEKQTYNEYCSDSGECGKTNEKVSETTLRDVLFLGDCRVSNTKHKFPKDNITFDAVDIACVKGEAFDVYTPSWETEYVVEKIGYGTNLGNFIILKHGDYRFVFGHTKARDGLKEGDRITLGIDDMKIGTTDLSGYQNTNYHVHFELWYKWENINGRFMVGDTKVVQPDSKKLLDKRKWDFGWKETYYFTHYDLGDVSQNDASPNIGASGKDLTDISIINPVAITVDIRKKYGIKFGDNVTLINTDTGIKYTATVHDEMNKRFREGCVLRPGTNYCIKGDIAVRNGIAEIPSGPYIIKVD